MKRQIPKDYSHGSRGAQLRQNHPAKCIWQRLDGQLTKKDQYGSAVHRLKKRLGLNHVLKIELESQSTEHKYLTCLAGTISNT